MKTARIPVKNELTGEKEYLTALFDTGSKRTYITECRNHGQRDHGKDMDGVHQK